MSRNDGKAVISSGVTSAHPLYSLSGKMTALLLDYKSTNINKSYFSSFNRWSAPFFSFFFLKTIVIAIYPQTSNVVLCMLLI